MEKLVKILNQGGVAVVPTDTLYGVVGKADDQNIVKRIFDLKCRSQDKPFIILISNIEQLKQFDLNLSTSLTSKLQEFWPGPNSLILNTDSAKLGYLHCGMKSLAFRLPDSQTLRELIDKTGPLVAPSANPEGNPPALTISEAEGYFGDKIDCYHDGGMLESQPSQLWRHLSGAEFEKIYRK